MIPEFFKSFFMWVGVVSLVLLFFGLVSMWSAGEFERMWRRRKHKETVRKANLLPNCPVEWKSVDSVFSVGEKIDAQFMIEDNLIIGRLLIGTKNNGLWDIVAFEFSGINSENGFEPKLKTDIYDLYKNMMLLITYFDLMGIKFVENGMKFWQRLENEVKKINNLHILERKLDEKP